jgi:hypothetical protein
MDSHREHGGEHQRNVRKHEPCAADDHDPDFGELDDSNESRLVVVVGELTRKSGQQEEWQDEERLRDGVELELLMRVRKQLVGDEQHHGLLEQAVVERAEELRREQRKETPGAQQVGNVLDQSLGAQGFIGG